MFWETISPESTLIQPQKTICLKGIVRWSTPFFPVKTNPSLKLFFFRLLDPWAQDSWCTGTANTASFACILAKRACMIKTSRYVPYELLENNLGLQNIYLCFMGFEEYSIGCWFCVLCCQSCLLIIAVSSPSAYVYLSQYLSSHFCPPDHSE